LTESLHDTPTFLVGSTNAPTVKASQKILKNNRHRDYKKNRHSNQIEIVENNRKKSTTDIEKNNRHRPRPTSEQITHIIATYMSQKILLRPSVTDGELSISVKWTTFLKNIIHLGHIQGFGGKRFSNSLYVFPSSRLTALV
jgi:hypothetical protein